MRKVWENQTLPGDSMSYYNGLADDLIESMKQDEGREYKVLDHGYVRYMDHMGSDQAITDFARICYGSVSASAEADKKLLMRLYRDLHTSPFEMGKIIFNIKLPIFCIRQLVRHRMQNLNETSARYKPLPNEFYIPKEWRVQGDKKNKQHTVKGEVKLIKHVIDGSIYTNDPSAILTQHCKDSYKLYEEMLAAGAGRELARMVLPLNIYTEIVCCWDMNNLLKFFRLRLDPHAQLEIQAYALAMHKIAQRHFPWCIEAYDRFPVVVHDRQVDSWNTKGSGDYLK
jgi:thymidylate synthase (FAD)